MVDRFWQGQTADGQPVSKVNLGALKNPMGAALDFHPKNSCKMPQVSSLKSHGSHGSSKKDNCRNRFRSS